MKALNQIYLPRVAKGDDLASLQTEERNQNNLQQNFRMCATAINTLEQEIANLPSEILAQVITPDAYVSEASSNGIWDWLKWSDGKIAATCKTAATVVNCSTADGSLYKGELTLDLPSGLFASVSSAFLTVICSANVVFGTVKSLSATQIVLTVLTTASASVTAEFCIQVNGE